MVPWNAATERHQWLAYNAWPVFGAQNRNQKRRGVHTVIYLCQFNLIYSGTVWQNSFELFIDNIKLKWNGSRRSGIVCFWSHSPILVIVIYQNWKPSFFSKKRFFGYEFRIATLRTLQNSPPKPNSVPKHVFDIWYFQKNCLKCSLTCLQIRSQSLKW